LGRFLAEPRFGKLEQQAKGVAIGMNRMGARLPLLDQVLGKEAGRQGSDRGIGLHGVGSQ
jgi:hypothetical protein